MKDSDELYVLARPQSSTLRFILIRIYERPEQNPQEKDIELKDDPRSPYGFLGSNGEGLFSTTGAIEKAWIGHDRIKCQNFHFKIKPGLSYSEVVSGSFDLKLIEQ